MGHPSATRLGCLVCVNSKSFDSYILKFCIMTVHTLDMCTFYFVQILLIFSHFGGVELRYVFHPRCLDGVLFV